MTACVHSLVWSSSNDLSAITLTQQKQKEANKTATILEALRRWVSSLRYCIYCRSLLRFFFCFLSVNISCGSSTFTVTNPQFHLYERVWAQRQPIQSDPPNALPAHQRNARAQNKTKSAQKAPLLLSKSVCRKKLYTIKKNKYSIFGEIVAKHV